MDRQNALIELNLTWLRQALELLETVGSERYTQPPPGFEPHKAGAHLRHVLEFYECFLDGLESGHIDYDARRRDESVERSRAAAAGRIRCVMNRLESAPQLRGDAIIWVRMEDADSLSVGDPFTTSSIGRELQVLSSHTIHHFALIAMTLRAHGMNLPEDFGVAPSTLRYRASQAA